MFVPPLLEEVQIGDVPEADLVSALQGTNPRSIDLVAVSQLYALEGASDEY